MIILFVIIVSFYFDAEIVQGVESLRGDALNKFFLGLTSLSSSIIIFFLLTSLFLWKERKRRWILPLWAALALSVAVSFVLKILVKKPRPFQAGLVSILPILVESSHSIWNFSFPSFHAMLVFCAIPILSKQFRKFKYVWVAFAVLIAFSRVYFGLHFMSDVVVGGLIGYVLGMIVVRLEKDYKFGEKIYNKTRKVFWGDKVKK